MKAVYWQRGESLDYINTGDIVIEANTIIDLKTRIAIAGTSISPGEKGSIHVTGVYRIAKTDAEAIDMCSPVYFDGNGITATAKDNTLVGYTVEQSAAGATDILVKLQG